MNPHDPELDNDNPYSQFQDERHQDEQHKPVIKDSVPAAEYGKVITEEVDERDGKTIRIIVETTPQGIIRDIYKDAQKIYHSYETHSRIGNMPLFNYQYGRDPRREFRNYAYGVVAVGQWAKGIFCLAQFSLGVVNVSQFSLGLLFSLSQFGTGAFFIGQIGIGAIFCLAQIGAGSMVIAQMGFGEYVLAQLGLGSHVWDMRGADPIAVKFFKTLLGL